MCLTSVWLELIFTGRQQTAAFKRLPFTVYYYLLPTNVGCFQSFWLYLLDFKFQSFLQIDKVLKLQKTYLYKQDKRTTVYDLKDHLSPITFNWCGFLYRHIMNQDWGDQMYQTEMKPLKSPHQSSTNMGVGEMYINQTSLYFLQN